MYGVKTMVPSGGCILEGFISCQIHTLMPSLDDVKSAISKYSQKDKDEMIILLSHIGGIVNPDMIQIAELCKKENIVLIEDCAHSFGATLNGLHSGLFGDAGVYSFYSTKAIPAGEGGVIITNNEEIGQMTLDFSIYDRFNQTMEIGFNNRVSEPQALLTYSVLKEWKQIVANKQLIAEKFMKACKNLGVSYIPQNENGQSGNYYKFVLYSEDAPVSEVFSHLKTKTSPVYDYSIGVENPLADYHLCLPIWFLQEEEITNRAIEELNLCFK
jgi:dTDP-4-amino-4,6-dideoxygalactose transaminase